MSKWTIFSTKISHIWFNLLQSFWTGLSETQRKEIMGQFLPKTIVALGFLLCGVFWLLNRCDKKKKTFRMILSCFLHFWWFCKQHTLFDFIFLVDKKHFSREIMLLNISIEGYTLYLARSHTISSYNIKSRAISEYLLTSKYFIQKLDPIKMRCQKRQEWKHQW